MSTTHDEFNPIVVLINLTRAYAEKDDFHSINVIIFSSQEKIKNLIGNSKDRTLIGQLLSGQRLIWDTIAHKAFQKKEFSVIYNIFLSLSAYHHFFSKTRIPLLYLEELEFFIRSTIERLVNEAINETLKQILVVYEKILEHHYDHSAPEESQLKELRHFFENTNESYQAAYGKLDTGQEIEYINLQWQKIDSDIPYIFSIIINKSIETKNTTLFDRTIKSISHLIHVVLLSELGEYQKAWLIRSLAGEFHYYQIEAIKKQLSVDRIHTIDTFLVYRMIDENSLAKQYALESASEVLIELHELEKLDKDSINFLGSIGRHCANKYFGHSGYKDAFAYILRVIRHLKMLMEKDLSKNQWQYMYLREAVESFLRYHQGDPSDGRKIDHRLLTELDELLRSFHQIEYIESEQRIEW